MSTIYSFGEFVFEAKKQTKMKDTPLNKKATPKKKVANKKDQDGDGDADFADAKIAQYSAGGMDRKKAIMMSRKFNK